MRLFVTPIVSGRLVAAIVIALAAATPARAQSPLPPPFISPFSNVFISTGTLLMDVSKVNERFDRPDLLLLNPPQRTGFDDISNDGYAVGIGGYFPYGRMLIGGEFQYADLGQESSPAGKTNQITTTYVIAQIGYAVFTGWHFTVYPILGVGGGNLTLTLKNRNGGASLPASANPTFDDVVLSPGAQSQMSGFYVLVQPGVGFDYLILRNEKDHVGLSLGIRITTSISPNRTTWKYQGNDVFGGPDAGPAATSIRLSLGVGGFRIGGK
jgi:opacity protein-like surface antigen